MAIFTSGIHHCIETLCVLDTSNVNEMISILYWTAVLSITRELLVMGGDSAKDQLRALAEGVCSIVMV